LKRTAEGRALETQEGNYRYEYHLNDHLGNMRLAFSDRNQDGEINHQNEVLQVRDYYPFGQPHVPLGLQIGLKDKYLFNGKELQEDFGLYQYDFGARTYDPQLARWFSVDPLAHKIPGWSPYSAMFNNPLRFVDPDGQYPIDIITRSYAPFKEFGPPFARYNGDNRGHSLSRNASYRTSATINYDTETYKRNIVGGRSLSYAVGASPEDGTYSNTYIKDRSSGNNLDVHSYGNNADVTGSWDIDQFTKLSVTTDGDIKGDHILNITGTISGDDFPNQESFVTDANGNSLWFENFATTGGEGTGPTLDLMRENEKDVNINVNIQINVNADGIFQSVIQGDKTISISDWNKQFEQ
jgi:RHS repeat-associated protein